MWMFDRTLQLFIHISQNNLHKNVFIFWQLLVKNRSCNIYCLWRQTVWNVSLHHETSPVFQKSVSATSNISYEFYWTDYLKQNTQKVQNILCKQVVHISVPDVYIVLNVDHRTVSRHPLSGRLQSRQMFQQRRPAEYSRVSVFILSQTCSMVISVDR